MVTPQSLPDASLILYCQFLVERFKRYYCAYQREYVDLLKAQRQKPLDLAHREALMQIADWADVLHCRGEFEDPWEEWMKLEGRTA